MVYPILFYTAYIYGQVNVYSHNMHGSSTLHASQDNGRVSFSIAVSHLLLYAGTHTHYEIFIKALLLRIFSV